MWHLSPLELVKTKWRCHAVSTPTAPPDVFETEYAGVFHETFAFRPGRSIICDLQNAHDRTMNSNPFGRTFRHLKMRNKSSVYIRSIPYVDFVVAQLQNVREEAIPVRMIRRSAEFRVFVRNMNVR